MCAQNITRLLNKWLLGLFPVFLYDLEFSLCFNSWCIDELAISRIKFDGFSNCYILGTVSTTTNGWGKKAKECNTCIAPQAAYHNCRGAVHVTDSTGIGPIGRRLSLRSQADLWSTSRTQPVCRLMVSTPRNLCNYMDYYSFSDPGGMEGWVGLIGWPIADTLSTKWSHVNHRWGTDQGKFTIQRPTS